MATVGPWRPIPGAAARDGGVVIPACSADPRRYRCSPNRQCRQSSFTNCAQEDLAILVRAAEAKFLSCGIEPVDRKLSRLTIIPAESWTEMSFFFRCGEPGIRAPMEQTAPRVSRETWSRQTRA